MKRWNKDDVTFYCLMAIAVAYFAFKLYPVACLVNTMCKLETQRINLEMKK